MPGLVSRQGEGETEDWRAHSQASVSPGSPGSLCSSHLHRISPRPPHSTDHGQTKAGATTSLPSPPAPGAGRPGRRSCCCWPAGGRRRGRCPSDRGGRARSVAHSQLSCLGSHSQADSPALQPLSNELRREIHCQNDYRDIQCSV